jgi:predicted nucleic acid-binding protein
MRRTVIVNTSPLFYLHKVGHLNILEKLYREIVIPEAVAKEIEEGKRCGEDVPKIKDYSWVKVKKVRVPGITKITPDLGPGEIEVLALGSEETDPLLIMDDILARKIAKLQAFKLTGTVGVLLRAKEKKLITELKPVIERLKKVGFYLSDNLILEILKASREAD